MFSIQESLELLSKASVFFDCDDEDTSDDGKKWAQTINLNDAFYWACSDGEYVDDSELPRLAELFWRYGYCGVIYWVAVEKRGGEVPEFLDARRFIEFVRQEELLRNNEPSSSKRAYAKLTYTLGD